jgi:hypothetical protein
MSDFHMYTATPPVRGIKLSRIGPINMRDFDLKLTGIDRRAAMQ